jgi:hypothetical protein
VPRMEEVEHSVGECYPTLPCSSPPFGLGPRRNLFSRVPRLQSPLVTCGWKWMTRSFLSGSLMTSS